MKPIEDGVYVSQLIVIEDFYVFNEVSLSLYHPVLWKKYGDYVELCKIDHIVVGKSGIFLIETKNWDNKKFEAFYLHDNFPNDD